VNRENTLQKHRINSGQTRYNDESIPESAETLKRNENTQAFKTQPRAKGTFFPLKGSMRNAKIQYFSFPMRKSFIQIE
jgi:hypothetical protein